jgi:hypothetical protein
MAHGWTPDRKEAQRKAIYRWRPWEISTGPKSKAGKVAVAANAFKHGARSRVLKRELQAIRRLIAGESEP